MITAINLSSDRATYLSLDVPAAWQDAAISQLQPNGSWLPCAVKRSGKTIAITTDLMLMEPVVIRLSK